MDFVLNLFTEEQTIRHGPTDIPQRSLTAATSRGDRDSTSVDSAQNHDRLESYSDLTASDERLSRYSTCGRVVHR